jgi:hypothetical protein
MLNFLRFLPSKPAAGAIALAFTTLAVSAADAATNGGRKPWGPMTCVPKGGQFSVCGSASTTRVVAGFQIRFMELLPNGTLVQRGASHASCEAARRDRAVPLKFRKALNGHCQSAFKARLRAM